jgi:diguanylate cyclase (GGDEF)-like protein
VSDGPSRDPRSQLPAAIEAATADDLDMALRGILEAAVAGLGATGAALFLADPDRAGLQLGASIGLDETDAGTLAEATAGQAARYDQPSTDGEPLVVTSIPLVIGRGGVESTLGALVLSWPTPHTTSAEDRAVIESLAGLAALAADRARHASDAAERSEWFERMAHTDPLTGIANERTVARVLELELARAGRQGSEVALALFDVDDFRTANASDGQQAGDDILRRVAAVLAESVRLVDTVGRIGGDEFVLVAPGAAGAIVARRVQDGIAALPATAGRGVSVSAGVATFPTDGGDVESLIAAANAALERAKAAGAGTVADAEAVPGTPT